MRTVLSRLGVATADDVATVRELHGRALCSQVRLADGTRLFVKQSRRGDPAVRAWPDGEPAGRHPQPASARYSTLADDPVVVEARAVAAIQVAVGAGLAPRLVAVDDALAAAVYEGHQHWTPLADVLRADPGCDADLAAVLGASLARLHAVRREPDRVHTFRPTGALGRPSADWFTPTPRSLAAFPGGYREVWVRAAEALPALDDLAASWDASALIHADVKSDNVLVAPDRSHVVLVDWETAGWGDPLWDLGCLAGDLVWMWLQDLPLAPGRTLPEAMASARLTLAQVGEQVRALVAAYDPASTAGKRLAPPRVLAYAGAYLLQRAVAVGMQRPHLDPRTLLGTHLATRLLLDPDRMAQVLR